MILNLYPPLPPLLSISLNFQGLKDIRTDRLDSKNLILKTISSIFQFPLLQSQASLDTIIHSNDTNLCPRIILPLKQFQHKDLDETFSIIMHPPRGTKGRDVAPVQ